MAQIILLNYSMVQNKLKLIKLANKLLKTMYGTDFVVLLPFTNVVLLPEE